MMPAASAVGTDSAMGSTRIAPSSRSIAARGRRAPRSANASRTRALTTAYQTSTVGYGAAVSSQPKLPTICSTSGAVDSSMTATTSFGSPYSGNRPAVVTISSCATIHPTATAPARTAAAEDHHAARCRASAATAPGRAATTATPSATAAQIGPEVRRLIRTAPETTACTNQEVGGGTETSASERRRASARHADQKLNAAAISRALGLTDPAMNRHIGVSATATPQTARRGTSCTTRRMPHVRKNAHSAALTSRIA